MNTPEFLTIPLDKKEKGYLRHKWHRHILAMSTLLTILVIVTTLISAAVFFGYADASKILGTKVYDQISGYLGTLLMLPFAFFVLRIINSAKFSATGAGASEQQFEHVYLIVEYYSKLANLKHVPTVAVVSGVDFVANTVSNFGKAVILVNSDLLDAPRPDSRDWGALRFAIAREVGHIAAGHRDFSYSFFTAITQSLPYLRNPLLRAEACTADRYGAALAPEAAADYFAVNAVSKDCWLDMSIRAAIARAGQVRLGQMITGIIGDTPPTVWRLQSLAKFGIFKILPVRNTSESNEEYKEFLASLPILTTRIADLEENHAAFWLPPEPLSTQRVDELCDRGTNMERFTRAFAI